MNKCAMPNTLLSTTDLRKISETTEAIFREYSEQYNLNIDSLQLLHAVCEKENIKLIEEHLSDFNGERVSGFIKYKNDSDPSSRTKIVLSNSLPSTRKLFTLAHELGHYYMHKADGDMLDRRTDIDNPTEPKERQANEFAGQILIPERKVRQILGTKKYISSDVITKLSYAFKVSEGCMTNRLKNLDYIIV